MERSETYVGLPTRQSGLARLDAARPVWLEPSVCYFAYEREGLQWWFGLFIEITASRLN